MSVVFNSVDNVKPGSSTSSSSSSSSTTDTSSLASMDEFLKMFVAQLQYQDPLDPMNNQDITAQLAQFSSLEQLTQINQNLTESVTTNALLNKSINNNMATTLIGKQIRVEGNSLLVTDGKSSDLLFTVPENAYGVNINILDADGKTVRTIDVDYYAEGNQSYTWNGRDNAGNLVDDGEYSFTIQGKNSEGEEIEISGYASGIVTGVRYDGNVTRLVCGDLEYDISKVIEVMDAVVTPTEEEEG